MGKIIAFSNQKGGVGKTTTCINMSAFLAQKGYKVLIVDLDPQGNASTGLGIEKKDVLISTYGVLVDEAQPEKAIRPSVVENLDVLPSNIDLAGAEVEMVYISEREFCLKKALSKVRDNYDFIMIDCPPALGLLTINALTAADSVLIPIQSEFFALEGLSQLMNTFKLIIKKLNPKLEIEGVIVTMFDARSATAKEVNKQVVNFFGKKIFTIAIPRNVRLSEAPSYGMPVMMYDKGCAGSKAYEYITNEFLKRQKKLGDKSNG